MGFHLRALALGMQFVTVLFVGCWCPEADKRVFHSFQFQRRAIRCRARTPVYTIRRSGFPERAMQSIEVSSRNTGHCPNIAANAFNSAHFDQCVADENPLSSSSIHPFQPTRYAQIPLFPEFFCRCGSPPMLFRHDVLSKAILRSPSPTRRWRPMGHFCQFSCNETRLARC